MPPVLTDVADQLPGSHCKRSGKETEYQIDFLPCDLRVSCCLPVGLVGNCKRFCIDPVLIPIDLSKCLVLFGLDDPEFETRQWKEMLLFSKTSRPALGPIKPPIQWQGREVDHLSPSSSEVMNEWSYSLLPLHVFMARRGQLFAYYF